MPVVKTNMVHVVLAIAVAKGWHLNKMDIKNVVANFHVSVLLERDHGGLKLGSKEGWRKLELCLTMKSTCPERSSLPSVWSQRLSLTTTRRALELRRAHKCYQGMSTLG